ncbi:MAG: PAS domain S-box protein [Halobacteriota archaeon]
MTAHATHGDGYRPRVQILVRGAGDRAALEELLEERYEVVIAEELQSVDCYLVGDRMLPTYGDELRTLKRRLHPTFCPVLLLHRAAIERAVSVGFERDDDEPPLIDEVVSAPIDSATLYRRLQNLLARREQSVELTRRYDRLQNRFERVFDATNDAIFVISPNGDSIVECNPAACELVEYTHSELRSSSPTELLCGIDDESFQSFLQHVLQTGSGWSDELTCETKHGDTRQLEISAATLESETETSVILSARDVTERKKREREYRRFKQAVEHAGHAVIITDTTGRIEYVNPAFERITGYTERDARGANPRILKSGEHDETLYENMWETILDGDIWQYEIVNERKDGEQIVVDQTIAPVFDDEGNLDRFVGIYRDVTDRKERERELELFHNAVEQAGHAVVITDRGGTIEYVNPAYERDTEYTRTEAVGTNPRRVKSGKQDESFYETLWETILSGDVWEADIVNRRKSGTLYHVEQTIAPITDEDGRITHFVGVESDVTDRRLREQRLSVLNRILRHNVRNCMTVVRGNAKLLQESLEGDLLDRAVTIEANADDMIRISEKAATVRRLFERGANGGDPSELECDIGATLSKLTSEFEDGYPEADLSVAVPENVVVRADDRLEVAIREAVDNAIVHNDRETPEVTIRAERRNDEFGEWVDVVIADTGPGMPAQEQKVIELDREKPLFHGTGLGIWLINWVVASFGGEVTIDENGPRGSVVRLRLPRKTT